MIALLLSLLATMSGAHSHAVVAQARPAAALRAPSIPIVKPMTGHPLAG